MWISRGSQQMTLTSEWSLRFWTESLHHGFFSWNGRYFCLQFLLYIDVSSNHVKDTITKEFDYVIRTVQNETTSRSIIKWPWDFWVDLLKASIAVGLSPNWRPKIPMCSESLGLLKRVSCVTFKSSVFDFFVCWNKFVAKSPNGRCDAVQQQLVPGILCFVQLRQTNHPTLTEFVFSALQFSVDGSILIPERIQYQHVWIRSPLKWCNNVADNACKSRWFFQSWVKTFSLDCQSHAQSVWFSPNLQGPERKRSSENECLRVYSLLWRP